ncbi:CinA family protein [Idiomarina seosinensis]|uniref:Damage-inducible protein CinA n=1 Tax=Idiomarina seosinensis TaxID=281739 RepID=A0A432ZJE3_9GAMM|nr:CinA family protein [Idiomarina seosinensis]RUO77392.1 damage-inducible protein CinA [Idiomarina seosinensis]
MVTSQQNWAQLISLATVVGEALTQKKQTLATAESCTGGGIGYVITEVAGSSAWFNGGLITYTNALKQQWLQVPESVLNSVGAVSAECVAAMAQGARKAAAADWSIAVSGIAGPGGGSASKPVGLVWLSIAGENYCETLSEVFTGDRQTVREKTIVKALSVLLKNLEQ